jgi:hypothetical protein
MYRPDGDYLSSYKTFLFGVLLPRERSSIGEALTIRSRHIDCMATADLGAGPPG